MMSEISAWLNSLDAGQQVVLFVLVVIFAFGIYWTIEGLIANGVKKGIKEAHYELIEEWKRKHGG